MKQTGKILFFNANDGHGIIITSEKKKLNFSVEHWDDFDVMPSLGLEVSFIVEDDKPLDIKAISSDIDIQEDSDEEIEPTISEDLPNETAIQKSDILEENISKDEQDKTTPASNIPQELEESFIAEGEPLSIENVQKELGRKVLQVKVTMNLATSVGQYFDNINKNIEARAKYKALKGRLDYLIIRRFLWTTHNNLSEIDLHILTPRVKAISDDLKFMTSIYDDFINKTKYPLLAYEEVFLSCQEEYKKIRDNSEKTILRINQLKASSTQLEGMIQTKKSEIKRTTDKKSLNKLNEEFKAVNGTYVDVVHMMAELDERYKHDIKLINEFEKEYQDDFYELFSSKSIEYKSGILEILSSQAFCLDENLWKQAKLSKAVKVHFHKSNITGEFNTQTYLKYFLDTQDEEKATDETKKLFGLYKYLVSLQKEYILVILSDVNDAMDIEGNINKIDKSYVVKAFVDEKDALKWALKNSVKVLILENQLVKMTAELFLKYYKKYILVIPKIILLGDSKKSDDYVISKLLPSSITPKVIAQNVKELIEGPKT